MSRPRLAPMPDKLNVDTPQSVIHCGDALEVLQTLEPNSVDFIFTDPPYGHNNNNGDLIHRREAALGRLPSGSDSPQGRPIANDGVEANDLFVAVLPLLKRVLKDCCCCCCCCCGGGGPDPQFARWSLWIDEILNFMQMVVWDKGPMGMGWRYRRSYETVLVAYKGDKCRWFDTSHSIENILRPGDWNIRKIIPQSDDHPTPKPWQLAAHFIELHTQPGDTVLDPFMGGGSTWEACVRLGRKFVGIELNPEYVEMARRRIADVTPSMFQEAP